MPLFTQKRSSRATRRYFNRRWANAETPPWGELRDDPIELRKAELLSAHVARVTSVLDCGCGGGDFLALVAPHARIERAVGIDVADNAVERAQKSGLYQQVVCAHLGDARRQIDGRFDLMMFGEVLYYLPDHVEVLGQYLDAFLAPRGVVFIALAVGRDYFRPRDVELLRRSLRARGLEQLTDTTIDYTFLGIPKKKLIVFPQAYKAVLIYGGGDGA